ncbi:MAG: type II secretion system protein [Gammaproteobacteria bacterium]|nr:type II secretion system protein [Gammaproteobacteria bacterium]
MNAGQRGVTLIELVASIVIVSVATIALMTAIAGVTGHSADPMVAEQATAIADSYLEEAQLAGFCDPSYDPDHNSATTCRSECTTSACAGGCGGASFGAESGRASFDDVCDYAGIDDAGARDRDGNAIAGLSDYTVTVEVVDSGTSLGAPALDASAGQVVRIDVTVEHAGLAAPVRLSAFKANVQ